MATDRPGRAGLFLACLPLLALLPSATVEIPAMVDYPNHLARMKLIVALSHGETSPFYVLRWAFYPNLALDLLVPLLARLVDVETAMRIFLAASQIAVGTGIMALEYAVKGRIVLGGPVAAIVLWSGPFAFGFLNFQLAFGIALWGMAAWIAMQDGPIVPRFLIHSIVVSALFASHMMALGLYGFTLGVHEVWRAASDRNGRIALALRLVQLSVPVVVLYILLKTMGGAVGTGGTEWSAAAKIRNFFVAFNGYSSNMGAAYWVIAVGVIQYLARRSHLQFTQSGRLLAAGFAGLYLLMPFMLVGTAYVDTRVLVGAMAILPAFTNVSLPEDRAGRVIPSVGIAMAVLSCLWSQSVSLSYQPIYRAFVDAARALPPHSRIIAATELPLGDPPVDRMRDYPLFHAPTLAVGYGGAFVPQLFTTVGKQPIGLTDTVRRLDATDSGLVPMALLRAIAIGTPPVGTPENIGTWTDDFDFAFVVGEPAIAPLIPQLSLVRQTPWFSVYRVVSSTRAPR
ncbi:hypothetical protein [Alsobacter sp. R-9]